MTTRLPSIPRRAKISHGKHNTYGDGTCAMEMADYLARRRRGMRVRKSDQLTDAPACVCPIIRKFMISWNDSLPSDAERRRLLVPLIPFTLDTVSIEAVRRVRSYMALDWLIRVHTATWLQLAGLTEHAEKLRELAPVVDMSTAKAASASVRAARAAAWDAARADARAAAGAAARAAAGAAAGAAAWDAARADAWDALADTVTELQGSASDLVRRMCEVTP